MTDKKFKMVGDVLEVTITATNEIYLPNKEGKNVLVGTYDQKTVQKIDKEHIKTLREYVKGELEKANKQLKGLEDKYEPIKDLKDLDQKIVDATTKALQKGTKAFKEKAIGLSKHIDLMQQKKQLKTQIDYIESQIVEIQKDLDGIASIK